MNKTVSKLQLYKYTLTEMYLVILHLILFQLIKNIFNVTFHVQSENKYIKQVFFFTLEIIVAGKFVNMIGNIWFYKTH